jgi:hypothetical protein
MADFDVINDKLPKRLNNRTVKPTIAELKAAIAGSGVAASYPTRTLNSSTRNDLIRICRQHSIAVATAL